MTDRRQSSGNDTPVRDQDKVMLRLPDGMRDRLKAAAEVNKRSMNAEIVERLDRSFYEKTEASFLDTLIASDFTSPLPPGLAGRIQDAAADSKRSLKEEVIFRLEKSFEAPAAYNALAELAIESMRQNARDAEREVQEYRVMVGTIRMMRHTIDRLSELVPVADMPADIANLLELLTPDVPKTTDVNSVLVALYNAMEERDRIVADQEAEDARIGPNEEDRKQRLHKVIEAHIKATER